jgi:hypothetical protein
MTSRKTSNKNLRQIVSKEMSLRTNIFQENVTPGNFFRANVIPGKCHTGKKSFQANFFRADVSSSKFYSRQMSSGQMSLRTKTFEKMSSWQMSFWAIITPGKCLLGKSHSRQILHQVIVVRENIPPGKTLKNHVVKFTTAKTYSVRFQKLIESKILFISTFNSSSFMCSNSRER